MNALVAYPVKDGRLRRLIEISKRVMLDSGAFTAYTQGRPVDLDQYIEFVHRWRSSLFGYINLDVIGDPRASAANLAVMRAAGLSPLPVWTRGQSKNDLRAMFGETDWVAVGGLVGAGLRHDAEMRVGVATAVAAEAPGRRLHLLGYTGNLLERRPYSCDSSSWSVASRFGILHLYIGGGRLLQLKGRRAPLLRQLTDQESAALISFGFRPDVVRDPSFWCSTNINRITYTSYMRYLVDCERNGTLLFLADASVRAVTSPLDLGR